MILSNRMKVTVFLTLFLSLPPAFAAVEPWTGIIQDAQKSALAKNRKVATAKLIEALKTEKYPPKGRAKVQEALKNISEMFFTDKGQRLFETGQSSFYESADTALTRFREALEVEDSNLTILAAMSRAQLSKKDCAASEGTLKTAMQINPYSDTVKFLRAKTYLCNKSATEAATLLKTEPLEDPVVAVTLASAFFEQGISKDAMILLQKAAKQDSSFPEVHYWLWKVNDENPEAAEEQGLKYVALCKNMNLRTRQKYVNEPRLCAQTQEVEDAIKITQKNSEP
jgi:predicted Zn-dependent protease